MTRLALYLVFLLSLVASVWDWWPPPIQNGPKSMPEATSGATRASKDEEDTIPYLRPVATTVVSDRGGNHVAVGIPDLGELVVGSDNASAHPGSAEPATKEAVDGTATWYGWDFAGRPMANGAPYNPLGFTVASNRYSLGTKLLVEYRASVEVEVTDRGAFTHEIDMSIASFKALVGSLEPGRIRVTVREVAP